MIDGLGKLVRAPYFDGYLSKVKFRNLLEELTDSGDEMIAFLKTLDEYKLRYSYAEGKWTISQVILHCIETETIFNYRALTIARENSPVELRGFDENAYAKSSPWESCDSGYLEQYFNSVRANTLFLSETITKEQMNKVGIASGKQIQVKALFYLNSGHSRHHLQIIKERYF
jgi:hypothetical protein